MAFLIGTFGLNFNLEPVAIGAGVPSAGVDLADPDPLAVEAAVPARCGAEDDKAAVGALLRVGGTGALDEEASGWLAAAMSEALAFGAAFFAGADIMLGRLRLCSSCWRSGGVVVHYSDERKREQTYHCSQKSPSYREITFT